jgi:hypothetical protein
MTEMIPIFDELIATAQSGDWEKVDDELVPKLKEVEGNSMALKLLEKANDPNSDIRDVVASSLNALNIKDQEIFSKVVREMIRMASTDQERFPAGRAVMFLLSHKDKGILTDEIRDGIEKFKKRPEISEWKDDLVENISDLTELLK